MDNNKKKLTPEQANYRTMLLANTPLIDVRAPVEFAQGALPNATNLPLMNDNERHLVGICYKEKGQDAAIKLGYQLVENEMPARIEQWATLKNQQSNALIYCFRGGLRSRLSVQFLKDNGVDISLIPGGYKSVRRYLMGILEEQEQLPIVVLGGNTGCAKTELIQRLSNGLDIEGMANHRGSSFGKQVTPQPRQINYEHQLALKILQIANRAGSLVIEDESKRIGQLMVPLPLFKNMQEAPMVIIDDPLELRLQRLSKQYCADMWLKFKAELGAEQGWTAYENYLHQGLWGIHKRLGLERFKMLKVLLDQALQAQKTRACCAAHQSWIEIILRDYYDPMYQYQLASKTQRIQFSGSSDEVAQWLMMHKQSLRT
ncbi:tRNA 2-selenouridine synthase [Psychromonas sp. CNPT3]|uniref:tRNA 2-selenouridine(34) synthase MnmH n=1 Tax=Psychromonas sp. CNPT3 TaxID=314282 RepID=UPI00006E9E62|nr:tRNA 2-selenouridine(34) synthase MnmH [Psychromonas sp. CNPT3]AGH82353.1 tRNA 2-selenouridine synthase [Psychromonas sp. CNPT3]